MVTERRSFQRVYDLTDRVLPSDVDTRSPEDDELGRFLVTPGVGSLRGGRTPKRDPRTHPRSGKKSNKPVNR